jgi:predicted SnoaL-like aldol condensation-catalyzing enzyme
MKIGKRIYNEQEAVIIETFKNHIQLLQKEIDEHWDLLQKQIANSDKDNDDYLWDYVMNDFLQQRS